MNPTFKKYMNPYTLFFKLISALLLFMMGMFSFEGKQLYPGRLLVFVVLFLLSLLPMLRGQRFFRDLAISSDLKLIEMDFAKAIPFVKGRVRLGRTYIFTKGSGKLVAYSDIVQVYQRIHSTNHIENARDLIYVDINGKEQSLCTLRLRGKSDSEVRDMFTLIRSANPNVKIGV